MEGATYKINTPLGHAFITVNHEQDGNPFEVFVTIGKAGSEVAAMAEALGRLISTNLRFGNTVSAKGRAIELVNQLRGIGGSKSVGFGPNRVRSLPDAVAKALAMDFGLMEFEEAGLVNDQATKVVQQTLLNGKTDGQVNHESQLRQDYVGQAGIMNNGIGQGQPLQTAQMPLVGRKMDLCPECKEASFVYEEGCKKCYNCGYSEC